MTTARIHRCINIVLLITYSTESSVSLPSLSPTGNTSVIINSSLILTCTYSDLVQSNPYYISWFRDNLVDPYLIVDPNCKTGAILVDNNYNLTCPDRNQQSLTINRVDLTYQGTIWVCEFTESPGIPAKSASSTTIIVNVPVIIATLVEPVENRINVTEGVPRRFMCKTSPCRPASTVSWHMQHGGTVERTITVNVTSSFTMTANNLTVTQSTLFYSASRNDKDYIIYCNAVNTDSSIVTSTHQPMIGDVLYAPDGSPTIEEYNGNTYTLIENTNLTLTCFINGGNPRPTLTWVCIGGSTTDTYSDTETRVTVMWTAKRDKDGPCICSSYHPTLSTNLSVSVNVQILYPPSTPIISINNVSREGLVKVINNTHVPLTCSSESKPKSTYSWTTHETIIQHGNSILLAVDRDRNVICTASNNMTTTSGGSVTSSSSADKLFQVLYGPSIPETFCLSNNIQEAIADQTVDVIEGDTLTLFCSSNGNPQPKYTWNDHGGGNRTVTVKSDLNFTCSAGNVLSPDYGDRVNKSASRTVRINRLYGPNTEPTLTYEFSYGKTGILKASVSVIENSSISITCDNSSSRPSPTYKWIGVASSQNGILNLNNITRSTNKDGNGLSYYDYKCMVHNSMTNTCGDKRTQTETFNLTGRVNVLYPATLNPVLDTGISEGNEFTLTATVGSHGSPRETYIWYYRRNATSTKTILATKLKHYLINVSRSNRGFYTIEATSYIEPTGQTAYNASVNKTFYLDVFYKPSVTSFVIDNQQGNVIVNENNTVQFVCSVDSNPVSFVFLRSKTYKGERQITESILTSNISHTLPGAACYDTGLYRCIGRNEYTSIPVFRENRLFVKCTPRPRYDVDQNITVYKALGDSVTLNLTIIAYPEPSSDRFNWAKLNGQNATELTGVDSNVQIQTDGIDARLIIASLSRAEFGQYLLTIKYDDSTDPYLHYFYINPKDKPQTPLQFKHVQDQITGTSAVLRWTPGFDGGLPQSFYILYRKLSVSIWSHTHVNGSNVTLRNLAPGTFYYVKIFASNSLGNSSVSDLLNITTKQLSTDESSTLPLAAIGGASGGALTLFALFIIVVVVWRRNRGNGQKTGQGRQSLCNEGPIYDSDGMERNMAYESAEALGFHRQSTSSDVYAQVDKSRSTLNDVGENTYAVVDKSKKTAIVQTGNTNVFAMSIKKKAEKKVKKGKKGKPGNKKGQDVYVNAQELDVYKGAAQTHDTIEENDKENRAGNTSPKRNVNKDGLLYADLTFDDNNKGQSKLVIIGLENATDYVEVDFSKKAEPLPESDGEGDIA